MKTRLPNSTHTRRFRSCSCGARSAWQNVPFQLWLICIKAMYRRWKIVALAGPRAEHEGLGRARGINATARLTWKVCRVPPLLPLFARRRQLRWRVFPTIFELGVSSCAPVLRQHAGNEGYRRTTWAREFVQSYLADARCADALQGTVCRPMLFAKELRPARRVSPIPPSFFAAPGTGCYPTLRSSVRSARKLPG